MQVTALEGGRTTTADVDARATHGEESTTPPSEPEVVISVILPAYNAARTIRRALESLQAQTFKAWEAIVVDDASSDDTGSVAGELARCDRRVKCFRNSTNLGPGESRNRAIGLARGAWIALLDADDTFAPRRLKALLSIANETEADVVADNLLIIDPLNSSHRLLFEEEFQATRPLSLLEFVEGCTFDPHKPARSGYTLMQPVVKRSFLAKMRVAFPPGCRNGEDFIFSLHLLAAGARWFVTPVPMYNYFITNGSQADIIKDYDREAMCRSVGALLSQSAASNDRLLARRLREFLRVSCYLYWSGLIKGCIKRRSARPLLRNLMRNRSSFLPFAREALHRSPRLCRRGISRLWVALRERWIARPG